MPEIGRKYFSVLAKFDDRK